MSLQPSLNGNGRERTRRHTKTMIQRGSCTATSKKSRYIGSIEAPMLSEYLPPPHQRRAKWTNTTHDSKPGPGFRTFGQCTNTLTTCARSEPLGASDIGIVDGVVRATKTQHASSCKSGRWEVRLVSPSLHAKVCRHSSDVALLQGYRRL
jgi:hypothetical protein